MTSLLFSSRNFVLSAAAAMSVFGLDGSLVVVEANERQRSRDPKQGYSRFKVGDAKVTAFMTASGKRCTILLTSKMPP